MEREVDQSIQVRDTQDHRYSAMGSRILDTNMIIVGLPKFLINDDPIYTTA